jgi:hypothetical protein
MRIPAGNKAVGKASLPVIIKPAYSSLYYLAFFLLSFFILWKYTPYIFFYQEKSSIFLFSQSFFYQHLNRPGGTLEYIAKLVKTFFYYPWAGAVLIATQLFLAMLLIRQTGKIITGRAPYVLPFLTGAALLYLQTNYQYDTLNTLGILLQLLIFNLSVRYIKGHGVWLLPVLFPAWYYLTGGFSWLFAVLFHLHVLSSRDTRFLKVLAVCWITSVTLFIASESLIFHQTTGLLLTQPFSLQNTGMQSELFMVTLIFIALLPLLFRMGAKFLQGSSIIRAVSFSPAFIIIASIILTVPRAEEKYSHYFHVENLFYQGKYDEIIDYNLKNPSHNRLTIFLNNIALCETGKLNEMLFRFPQDPEGGTLFLKYDLAAEVLKRGGHFYYTIGIINEAHRWAYEYMVMSGYTPETLKMLAKTELINGNHAVAAKYVLLLEETLFYRKEAKELKKLLYNDAAIETHAEYGAKKRIKPKTDFFVVDNDPVSSLLRITAADPDNIPALEYKFAYLLLKKEMDQIAMNLPLLEKAGFTKIPLHIGEVATAVRMLQPANYPVMMKLQPPDQTLQRFENFYQIFMQNRADMRRAKKVMEADFADTFWYYFFFG